MAYEINRCFWAAAQSKAINGQSRVHLDHRVKSNLAEETNKKKKQNLQISPADIILFVYIFSRTDVYHFLNDILKTDDLIYI